MCCIFLINLHSSGYYPDETRITRMKSGLYPDVGMNHGWSEGKGDAVLRRTALRFEGVASPPVRVCAGPILQVAGLRP